MKVSTLLCLVALAAPAFSAYGGDDSAADDFIPNITPSLHITRATLPIVIDGDLSDGGWRNAAIATNFAERYPGDRTKPPIDVEAWLTYDSENLYMAFVLEDDPKQIRASLQDRDGIWQDDYVGILLDTYGNASWAYFIFANPLGIQGDARFVNGTGEDDGIDLIYKSDGRITETGYQVEFAIPFSSLRFPSTATQTWKATFWVTHPRTSRSQYTWSPADKDNSCWPCQWGTITGIEGITPGRNFEILPSLIGSQAGELADGSDPASAFSNGAFGSDFGIGLKGRITDDIVADLAINPDFSQVEADADQIDVNSTFALFFSERRPFFQEGGDIFRTYRRVVYTRTINDPSVAVKFSARFGDLSMGYMGARDEHSPLIIPLEERSVNVGAVLDLSSTSHIFRAKQSYGTGSYVGLLVTSRSLDGGGSGSVFSLDGRQNLGKQYRFEYQLMPSRTLEPGNPALTASEDLDDEFLGPERYTAHFDGDKFWGWGSYLSLERDGKYYNFDFDYVLRSPTFRADNGFITQNNSRQFTTWHGLTFYFDNAWLTRINPGIRAEQRTNWDGLLKRQLIEPQISFNFKRQTNLWMGIDFSKERFGDDRIMFTDIVRKMINLNSNFSDPLQIGFFISTGDQLLRDRAAPVLAQGTNYEVWGTIKPLKQFVIIPNFSHSALFYPATAGGFPDQYPGTPSEIAALAGTEIFSGSIFRTRINYQFTKELFLRLVLQYNEFSSRYDVDPLLTYRINPFSAIYVGTSLDYRDFATDEEPPNLAQTNRIYFFKVQYLFQL